MSQWTIGQVVRTLFGFAIVGAIVVALLMALQWALNPEEQQTEFFSVRTQTDEPVVPAADDAEDADEQDEEPEPEEAEPEEPEETEEPGLSEEERQALTDAAPDPAETSVQVLDAGGGSEAMNAAADDVRELGYNVVNVTPSQTQVDATTAWWSDGHEPAAEAMRARDERIIAVGPNERLSDGVNLHLLVGPDWE